MKRLHTDTEYGTHHQPIIKYITDHGLYCYVDTNSSIEELIHYLTNHKLPIVIHYVEPSEDADHYSLVIGFTDDEIILHDPWNGPKFKLSKKEFTKRWHDKKGNFPQWMLVASKEPIDTGKLYKPKNN